MTGTKILFSPQNQLTHEVKQLAAEIHQGTPAWAFFPRWFDNGQSMWLESSSGSRLLTVDFSKGQVIVPQWKDGGRTQDMPESWEYLYLGSLFNPADGSALHRDMYDYATAQEGWKRA